ncbi:unnamed protein product, partial [Symbiodinium sp. CCMP2456]
ALVALAATLWPDRPAWLLFDGTGTDSKEPLLDFSPRSPLQDDEILAEPEEAPSRLLREEALERRPRRRIKGGLPPAAQLRMTRRARSIAASWAAILSTNGMGLVVDGRVMLVRLEGRQIHFDSEAFSLQEMALQLDGRVLSLLVESHTRGCRSFHIELDDAGDAVELALTLKVLRAEADTGAGVGWLIDRPLDQLWRPTPAE